MVLDFDLVVRWAVRVRSLLYGGCAHVETRYEIQVRRDFDAIPAGVVYGYANNNHREDDTNTRCDLARCEISYLLV